MADPGIQIADSSRVAVLGSDKLAEHISDSSVPGQGGRVRGYEGAAQWGAKTDGNAKGASAQVLAGGAAGVIAAADACATGAFSAAG